MIVLVYGTRPEAIKLGPVAAELAAADDNWGVTICTGQHTSLLRGTPAETDLGFAISLDCPANGNVAEWTAIATDRLIERYRDLKPSLVVVQGDTMSAHAGALSAARCGLPLAHVEAGVRSGNLAEPFPEEAIRRDITRLADWHLAATGRARENLLAEGVAVENIFVTGNSVVSALQRYSNARPGNARGDHLLVTLHRRELVRDRARFRAVAAAIASAATAADVIVTWPVHPATLAMMDAALGENVVLADPLEYQLFASLLCGMKGVLTDSGGLQEECATLGVPCAVLRNVTDRPESIEAGVARLFPPNAEGAAEAVRYLAGGLPRTPLPLFGLPNAAANIARLLEELS